MSALRPRTSTIALALFVLAATTLPAQADPPRPVYVIIAHPDNATATVERQFLADAFLKKVRAWPSGEFARPVDLEPRSPVRQQFSNEILKRPVYAVRGYWQQRIFSGGDLPPPEVDTEEEVVKYVLRNRGAVGYVSPTTNLNGARVLTVK